MALTLNSNLVLSGSLEITGSFETSGSSTFNGTFTGDGSSLTGVTGSWDGNFSGSAVMTGSLDMTGSISATSFSGDGSSLTGVTAEFDGSHTGSASFSGSLEIQGRVTQIGLGESTYFGDQAGEDDDITTNKNTGIGFAALKENTEGCQNVAVGHNAFKTNTDGDFNVALGSNALLTNDGGNHNTAVGSNALANDNSGDDNVAIGSKASIANTSGDRNVGIGAGAICRLTTGNCNTAIGYQAGEFITGSSTGNVFIGNYAGPSGSQGISNKLYINNTTGSALIEGDFSLGQVTINSNLTASGIKATRIDVTGSNASSLGATTFDFGDVTFKSGSTGIVYRHQTGKLDFPDGFKAVFGSTDQLEIYKGASSDSFVDQINTGTLRFRNAGENVFSVARNFATADKDFRALGNITASGTISSSGAITAPSFTGDGSGLTNVSVDTKFQVFVTGSNGTSGIADAIMPATGSNTIDHQPFSSILGGRTNKISGSSTQGNNVIAGGEGNVILGSGESVIVGGSNNKISGSEGSSEYWNFIGGGLGNEIAFSGSVEGVHTCAGKYVVIGGGNNNRARGIYTVVGGGASNVAGNTSVVVGGFQNYANGLFGQRAFVGGGNYNSASACFSAIVGGGYNEILAQFGSIGGGRSNCIATTASFARIGGGRFNTGSQDYTFIGGGCSNAVIGEYSSIIGGRDNTINSGKEYSGILGGCNNTVAHTGSFAIGKDITTTASDTTFVNNFYSTGSSGLNNVVVLANLPTSDPSNAGQLWNDSGTLKVSAG